MDLPINEKELSEIIESLDDTTELHRKLSLTHKLMEEGQPYKKILRERYGYTA